MPQLLDEFFAARSALTPRHRTALIETGISGELIDAWGWFGIAPVRVRGDLYEPIESGPAGVITPVRGLPYGDFEHPLPDAVARFGDIIDLICWHPARPDRWALRVGAACVLGAILPSIVTREPVRLHSTPLGWLRAGGTGLCILARDPRSVQSVLLGLSGIVADDQAHGRRLARICATPYPLPTIVPADCLSAPVQKHMNERLGAPTA